MASVHEGKKNFRCDTCNASFSQKKGWNRHKPSFHEGKNPFECTICDTSFAYKHQMNGHIAPIQGRTLSSTLFVMLGLQERPT